MTSMKDITLNFYKSVLLILRYSLPSTINVFSLILNANALSSKMYKTYKLICCQEIKITKLVEVLSVYESEL